MCKTLYIKKINVRKNKKCNKIQSSKKEKAKENAQDKRKKNQKEKAKGKGIKFQAGGIAHNFCPSFKSFIHENHSPYNLNT